MMIGFGNFEFLKENVGHLAIVMLAGVDDFEVELILPLLQGAHDGSDLHEVGTRTRDQENFFGGTIFHNRLLARMFHSRVCRRPDLHFLRMAASWDQVLQGSGSLTNKLL